MTLLKYQKKVRGFLHKVSLFKNIKEIYNSEEKDAAVRVGFTITKKIGGAVIRNKIKRRFKAIIKEILNNYLKKNYDYVIIANKKSLVMDYKELKNDVIKVIK